MLRGYPWKSRRHDRSISHRFLRSRASDSFPGENTVGGADDQREAGSNDPIPVKPWGHSRAPTKFKYLLPVNGMIDVLSFIFPKRCVKCRKVGSYLCLSCESKLKE